MLHPPVFHLLPVLILLLLQQAQRHRVCAVLRAWATTVDTAKGVRAAALHWALQSQGCMLAQVRALFWGLHVKVLYFQLAAYHVVEAGEY